MMNELIAAVTALVGEETQRAKENHGEKYASLHEGYGVLAEKVQLIKWLTESKRTKNSLELVEQIAIDAACECIQVAAVARKMREGM